MTSPDDDAVNKLNLAKTRNIKEVSCAWQEHVCLKTCSIKERIYISVLWREGNCWGDLLSRGSTFCYELLTAMFPQFIYSLLAFSTFHLKKHSEWFNLNATGSGYRKKLTFCSETLSMIYRIVSFFFPKSHSKLAGGKN